VGSKRHGTKQLGPYYWFTVAVLKPFLSTWTHWQREGLQYLTADYPPSDGVIVAANHTSWFDPLNVCHTLWDAGRPPKFLAKDNLFRQPGVGQILAGANQIPVFRESGNPRSAIREAIKAIEAGDCVVIYPEGTMTRDPNLWPMTGRTGAAQLAFATGAPVIPLAQWGPEQVMAPYKNEFNLIPRKTMETKIGPPVDLDDLREQPITGDVLREATRRIMRDITDLLEVLRGQTAPTEVLDFRDWKQQQQATEGEQQ